MKTDAQIICREEPFGVVCDWQPRDGKTAYVYEENLRYGRYDWQQLDTQTLKAGQRLKYANLRLIIVAKDSFSTRVFVRQENPHTDLYLLYRAWAESILNLTYRCEVTVWAFRLKSREGQVLPFTRWLRGRLIGS